MSDKDISLIPIEDLIKEIKSRCGCFVGAYFLPDDRDNLVTIKNCGRWDDSVMLSTILENDVKNNWSGELETLQEINDDKKPPEGEDDPLPD